MKGFITEVHHINEHGQDGGVVYSEMHGRQNSSEDILHYQLRQTIYPNYPYRFEHGGRTECIRKLTVQDGNTHPFLLLSFQKLEIFIKNTIEQITYVLSSVEK